MISNSYESLGELRVKRAASGKNYGVIVIPEGILEFVDEIQIFIIKLNAIIAEYNQAHDTDFHIDFPRYTRILPGRTFDRKRQPWEFPVFAG